MTKYIIGFFTFLGSVIVIWLIYLYAEIRFEIDKIVHYKPNLTTQFFDKNGELVANLFEKEHRLYVKYDDIPHKL